MVALSIKLSSRADKKAKAVFDVHTHLDLTYNTHMFVN